MDFFKSTIQSYQPLHRIWKETNQQPGTAGPGNMLGCYLVSFHFLWAILSTSSVHSTRQCKFRSKMLYESCLHLGGTRVSHKVSKYSYFTQHLREINKYAVQSTVNRVRAPFLLVPESTPLLVRCQVEIPSSERPNRRRKQKKRAVLFYCKVLEEDAAPLRAAPDADGVRLGKNNRRC